MVKLVEIREDVMGKSLILAEKTFSGKRYCKSIKCEGNRKGYLESDRKNCNLGSWASCNFSYT